VFTHQGPFWPTLGPFWPTLATAHFVSSLGCVSLVISFSSFGQPPFFQDAHDTSFRS